MGYFLQAIIGHSSHLKGIERTPCTKIARLEGDLGMILCTDEFVDELGGGVPFADKEPYPEHLWHLSASMATWIAAQSSQGLFAYIEADYHGGIGEQSAIVWQNGQVIQGPFKGWG